MRARFRARSLAALFAMAGLLALAAAACGGDGAEGDATASPTATGTASPTATPVDSTTGDGASDGLVVLEGVFETGFEHSAFYEGARCPQGEERWWVAWLPESRFAERLEEETGLAPFAEPEVRAFGVTIRAEYSERGEFGHLGQYQREVTVHELIEAATLSGCDDDASGGGGVATDPSSGPPQVLAAGGGSEVALGLGSYCWTAGARQPGLCADSVGIITNAAPLQVLPDGTVELTTSLDLAGATQLGARVQPVEGVPVASGPDWLAWPPSRAGRPLDVTVGPAGASFVADLAPGRYLVTLFVVVAQGDASYGLLLEVGSGSLPPPRMPQPTWTPGPTPWYVPLTLGVPIELAIGQDAQIGTVSGELHVTAVLQDSRCPSDAVCVWAGEVVVAFLLILFPDSHITRSIVVSPGGSASAFLYEFRLTVLEVRPQPTTAGPIAQSDYRVTVRLDRVPMPSAGSGVWGTVTLGPLCPVQREDQPCPDRSLAATIVLRDASGNEVGRATSGSDGRYQIAAPPGDYILDPQPLDGQQLPHAVPIEVTIKGGVYWALVDIPYDSGIR
ncbi:MAG: hypothetical protein O2895_04505 [Chloroflexi bacterium]|nr:hypothetical protein [Chloroflexota bacterium]